MAQEEELVKKKKLKSYKKKLEAFNGKLQTMTEHNDVPKERGLSSAPTRTSWWSSPLGVGMAAALRCALGHWLASLIKCVSR